MKIGLLSDIHGNWEALEIALSILESEGVDKLHCIGDIVGYGADPAVCIDQIERKCEKIVAGNHDWASIGKTDIMYFNMFGRKAILWTSRILAPHQKSFLAELPLYNACDNFCIVHSTPIEPSQWHYVLTSAQAMHQFEHFSQKICFIGHSHTPMLFSDKGNQSRVAIPQEQKDKVIKLSPNCRYIINIGSVGQPRDGDPRGSLVVYDNNNQTVKFIRFEYPIYKTQSKIISAGLPPFLAERLERGI